MMLCRAQHNLLLPLYTYKPARKDEIVNTCNKTTKQQSKHHEPGSTTRHHTAACASSARTRNQVDQCVPKTPAEVATCKPRNPTNTMCECSTLSGRDKGASIHLRASHCQVFMQPLTSRSDQIGTEATRQCDVRDVRDARSRFPSSPRPVLKRGSQLH
jgi:hypothetical protein